jgi:serine/threonine-protein kinase
VQPEPGEVTCQNCGSSFHVEPGATADYRPDELPERIGKFQVLELLGRGAFGAVYKAHDPELDRAVAVKVPRAGYFNTHEEEERFLREARSAARLTHPGIVPVHEMGIDRAGTSYFAMKLVDGVTLESTVAEQGANRLSPEVLAGLLEVFSKTCDAVGYAHSRGVIHCDLKPANVMTGSFGQVYVMDWGMAWIRRLSREPSIDVGTAGAEAGVLTPGMIAGTPVYMAPEQAQGTPELIDERTDVFGLGAILYHLLAGVPPYPDGSMESVLRKARDHELVPLTERVADGAIPQSLARIVERAMAGNREDRYPSAQELKLAVDHFLRGTWRLPESEFEPGTKIISEGEESHAAYLIVEGRCTIYFTRNGERVRVREIGSGDVFGELGVFAGVPRTATVEAIDRVKAIEVTKHALTDALGWSSWTEPFVRILAERFRDVDAKLRAAEEAGARVKAPAT